MAQSCGDACLLPYGKVKPTPLPACRPDAAHEDKRAAILLGDSHAAALGGALKDLAKQQGIAFYQLEKSSCAPLIGVARPISKFTSHAWKCAAYNEVMVRSVMDDPAIKTVILAAFWSAPFFAENDSILISTDPTIGGTKGEMFRAALIGTIKR